jgi:hypothetical protein
MKITEVTKEQANFQVQTCDIGTGKVEDINYFLTADEAYEFASRVETLFRSSNLHRLYGLNVLPANPTPAELLLGMF